MYKELCLTNYVNPARAGMIPNWWEHTMVVLGKPRASGDDPEYQTETDVCVK